MTMRAPTDPLVVEVGAHPDVGLEEVVLPVLVGDPALVEEHVLVGEAQGVGESTGGDRPGGGAKAPAPVFDSGGGRALPVLAHGREL